MCDPMVEQAIQKLGTPAQAASKLGVSKSTVYMILRGEREPSAKVLDGLGLTRYAVIVRAQ